jgi:peptidoglycan-N-acetylglucosamine deacetylase
MQRGGAVVGGMVVLLTLALPGIPETRLYVPDAFDLAPPLLEAEGRYPSPLRTALEAEPRYLSRDAEPAPAAIALTFDTEIPRGGEARQTVNEILDVLAAAKVHATFFVVGTWARANLEVLRRIADEGHEIANHSFDHRRFARRRAADVHLDLARVAELVERETGRSIAPLFRPPYGCVDATAARAARQAGYALVGWTAAGADAAGATETPRQVVAAVEGDLAPGAVVLLHTNRWITAAALPDILAAARARNLDPVPLSAMLQRQAVSHAELERRASRPCGAA